MVWKLLLHKKLHLQGIQDELQNQQNMLDCYKKQKEHKSQQEEIHYQAFLVAENYSRYRN